MNMILYNTAKQSNTCLYILWRIYGHFAGTPFIQPRLPTYDYRPRLLVRSYRILSEENGRANMYKHGRRIATCDNLLQHVATYYNMR